VHEIVIANLPVIASEAKQSRAAHAEGLDCFVASAPRNDGSFILQLAFRTKKSRAR
jgi:hypothetical protein